MKISDLAARTHVSVHALRHYERLGLLRPRRLPNGWREYDERSVREVVFIAMSRQMGFSLKRIAGSLPAYRAGRLTFEQMVDALHERVAELDAEIAARRQQRLQLLDHVRWLQAQQCAAQEQRERRATGAPPWPRARPPQEKA